MLKKLTMTALVATVALAAQAGALKDSVGGSLNGSSNILEGLLGSSTTTLKVVSGGVAKGVTSAAELSGNALDYSKAKVTFLIENPSAASKASATASVDGSKWVVEKSGVIMEASVDGSIMVVKDPSGAISAAGRASANAIRVTWDASGRLVTASGEALKNTYGEDYALVTNGSGEIYTLSEGSVVASANGTSGLILRIKDGSVQSMQTSAAEVKELGLALSAMPANSFEASKQSGRQNGDK